MNNTQVRWFSTLLWIYVVKPRNKRKQYLLRIRNTAPSRHSPTTIPSTTPMIIANTKSEKNITN